MPGNFSDTLPVPPLIAQNRAFCFVVFALAVSTLSGCRGAIQSRPTPYDGMVKQLHAGMTYDSMVARLGEPYLSEYNIGDHVSAIYRMDGTILPLIIRFQKAESLVIHDPTAPVDSWCAYVRVKGSGDSSVLVFTPTSMSAAEKAKWISAHADGFSFPGQAQIRDADPDRPHGDGGETKLIEARSVHNPANAAEDGSSQIALMDVFNLRLVCHPVF